jgi:hypothetical protein
MLLPDRQIFNIAKRYSAPNSCIYSQPWEAHAGRLEVEHIIPLSMGGQRELPASSCRRCATEIGRFEDRYFKGTMETARYHLGLQGRQKHKRRDRLPVTLMTGETRSIRVEQHPSALLLTRLLPPGFKRGMRPADDLEIGVFPSIVPATGDMFRRARLIGSPINLTRGIGALDCYRQIAKVAHGFAVAERGLGGVASFLLNLIHGKEPMLAGYLVGSSQTEEPPSDYLHEVDFADPVFLDGHEMLVVRIRLFAYLVSSPVHFVLVGPKVLHAQGQ